MIQTHPCILTINAYRIC